MRNRRSTILILLLAALLALSGCGGASAPAVPVQSVGMITGTGASLMFDSYAGIVESGETVNIEKDEGLELSEICVSPGDLVKEGQVLFTYNTEALSLELEKKALELEQLKNTVETKRSQIEELERDRANAGSSAQLSYTLQIQELQIEVAETGFSITAKEKEIERTKNALENGKVLSPVDGTIQKINESGGYDDYGQKLPFMTVTQLGDFRIKGTINEQNRGSLYEGCSVIVRSRVDSSRTWDGFIEMIDWNNPQSGNNQGYYPSPSGGDEMAASSKYPFYVALNDSEGLMLGQHVYIEPDNGQYEQAAMMLPAMYILDPNTSPWVWASNSKDKLEKRSVTLGEYDGMLDCFEILDGLTADDYIAFPDETCTAGAPVSRYDENSFSGDVAPSAEPIDGAMIYGGA